MHRLLTGAAALLLALGTVPAAQAGDPLAEGIEPGVFVALDFGGRAQPLDSLKYGFRMDYRSDTLRRFATRTSASDMTLRDEVARLSARNVPAMLKFEFGGTSLTDVTLGGVPLTRTLRTYQDEEAVEGDEEGTEEEEGMWGFSWLEIGIGAVALGAVGWYIYDQSEDDDESAGGGGGGGGDEPPAEECVVPDPILGGCLI